MSFNERRPRKNTFKKMTIELAVMEDDRFDSDDLLNVLSEITFDLININLTIKKSEVGLNGPGYTPIGFVNKFYSNEEGECMFDVAIFEKYSKIIERLENAEGEEIAIRARAFTNKEGKITKIIGLDIIPVSAE